MNLHAIEQTRLWGQRRVDGVEPPRHRADAVTETTSRRWRGAPAILFPHRSYGGLRWGIDLPEMLAPLAYILRMRTVPLRNLGGCMSPDNAWMALQGIETLPMRMEKHCENAMKVATHLSKHPKIEWVRYCVEIISRRRRGLVDSIEKRRDI